MRLSNREGGTHENVILTTVTFPRYMMNRKDLEGENQNYHNFKFSYKNIISKKYDKKKYPLINMIKNIR